MVNRLPAFMASGPGWLALLSILAARRQAIVDVLDDLLTKRSLSTATGAQLDGLGQILDLPRIQGNTDEQYRFALRSQVISLTKSGEPESVIAAYLSVTGAPSCEYEEIYPAAFQISGVPAVDLDDPVVVQAITDTMRAAKAAGVGMILQTLGGFEFSQASETDMSGNGPIDADHGFGSATGGETDGGGLSRVF